MLPRFSFFCFCTFLLSSCEPEVEPILALPEASQTGKNTLGFMLDNEVWVAYGKRCFVTSPCNYGKPSVFCGKNGNKVRWDFSAGLFTIEKNDYLYIGFENLQQIGVYALDTAKRDDYLNITIQRSNKEDEQYKAQHGFTFNISKLDTLNKIISGTFQGTLISMKDSTKTKQVKEGRFDATYPHW